MRIVLFTTKVGSLVTFYKVRSTRIFNLGQWWRGPTWRLLSWSSLKASVDLACFLDWLAPVGVVTSVDVAFGGIMRWVPALPSLVIPVGSVHATHSIVASAWLVFVGLMLLLCGLLRLSYNRPKARYTHWVRACSNWNLQKINNVLKYIIYIIWIFYIFTQMVIKIWHIKKFFQHNYIYSNIFYVAVHFACGII